VRKRGNGNSAADEARREFIRRAGAAAAAAAMPGIPVGAMSAGNPAHARGASPRRDTISVTLFFNLSHLGHVDTTHYLNIAGRKYPLTRVSDNPQVLQQARIGNAFLADLPDRYVTHFAMNVDAPSGSVTLAYLTCNENPASGVWEMTSICLHIPRAGFAYAYARARALSPHGALPLSGKRSMYGLSAATKQSDLEDESALVDVNSHAEALVGLHPDIVSVDPSSAAHIQSNYVSQDSNTQFLAELLQTMGPAAPEGTTSVFGMPAWATLLPLVDDTTGQPYKKSDGRLNQYYPDWSADVDQNAAPGMASVHPLVKNDPDLGIDVTGINLNVPGQPIPPEELTGKKWGMRDGIPTVIRAAKLVKPGDQQLYSTVQWPYADITPPDAAQVTFANQGPETGLYVSQPTFKMLADGRVQATLDNVSNWFLRYLAVYVQFLRPDDTQNPIIQVSQLPGDTLPSEQPGPYPRQGWLDKPDALFVGILPPALAVCGIPVYPGQFAPTINIPREAHAMRIFYAGLGLSGSTPAAPESITGVGIGMTVAFNYGVVGLFMAVGASTFGDVFKLVTATGGGTVAVAVTTLIGAILNASSPGRQLLTFAMGFLKVILQFGITGTLATIVKKIWFDVGEAEAADSVPVAGQIARAAAAIVGGIQLAETSIEIAISPPVYAFDVVEMHSLTLTVLPDVDDDHFPEPAPGYSLYYRVSYLFDTGTAHTLDPVTVPNPAPDSIAIQFTNIPRGGQVNVSIGFYMRADTTPPGQNDWCAGFGTTGLIDNTLDLAGPIRIKASKIPIQSTTQYLHARKSALDDSGNHYWFTTTDPPPYVPPPNGQVPGLGALNAITVRQATSVQQGYVGYAWKAFSSGVIGCGGSTNGQFDQMANLNTDTDNGGANAQVGYVSSAGLCGYKAGVRIGYNLLTHDALNVYVDTNALLIREVSLDTPAFAGPSSDQAFGKLNLSSTRCLMHPAGSVVSISNATHKLEVLKVPPLPVSDDDAAKQYLARTLSGPGVLPGLMLSPLALAIAPDGAILVLEQGNNRIQALDLGGNPVRYFTHQPQPYFLELDATRGAAYLDLAVEFSGYLYVLSKDGNNAHRLDIYHASQTSTSPICTTLGVNAAKLAVDFWRHLYTLNYEVLESNGEIPSFTEPSVSFWLPPPPTGASRLTRPR
jgi:hypothetical protein